MQCIAFGEVIGLDVNFFINSIVEEVIKRLQNLPKTALVIYTGSTTGFEEGIQELKKLKNDGWKIKVLFSQGAQRALNIETVRKSLAVDEIHLENEISHMDPCYGYPDVVVLPTLTQNTAVKIALGIADTTITNILSQGILNGIPIIAAKDGWDPIALSGQSNGKNKANTAYLEKMTGYLKTLESYDIQVVDASSLYQTILGNNEVHKKVEKHIPENIQQDVSHKKVISRADVINASGGNKTLLVSRDAIVTAYAKDAARDLGIRIVLQ